MSKKWLGSVGLVLAGVLVVFMIGYYSGSFNLRSAQQGSLEVVGSSGSGTVSDSLVTGSVTAGCENACWTAFYNSSASLNESFEAAVVDIDLNTYVTGYEQLSPSSFRAILKKYNSCGREMWSIPITTGSGGFLASAGNYNLLRTSGTDLVLYGTNLYVLANYVTNAGGTVASNVLVSKYDVSGASPALMWRKTYNNRNVNVGTGIDHQNVVNRVYVSGYGYSNLNVTLPYGFVLGYSATDGAQVLVNNTLIPNGRAYDLVAIDSPRSNWAVYVVGSRRVSSYFTYPKVYKLDLDGNYLWSSTYDFGPYVSYNANFKQVSYDNINQKVIALQDYPQKLFTMDLNGNILAASAASPIYSSNKVNALTTFNSKAYTAGQDFSFDVTAAAIRRFAYNSTLSLVQEWNSGYTRRRNNNGMGIAADRLSNMYMVGSVGQIDSSGAYTDAFIRKSTASGTSC